MEFTLGSPGELLLISASKLAETSAFSAIGTNDLVVLCFPSEPGSLLSGLPPVESLFSPLTVRISANNTQNSYKGLLVF